eukprot:TRINITY_DN2001_c0_g1_i1.p1 TRINITY_DN2001_c0_g1~~TRINITY_DN2001_c0_g1_i1.p1  ORF type:complete len:591 (+),score=182.67 TRINITY_DN2001_c0_g1_i1:45-1817(+)
MEENLTAREVAKRKITAFYARLFPEKLHTVDKLLDKYAGEEDDVIRTHKIKYPVWNWDYLPPPTSVSSQGASTRPGALPHSDSAARYYRQPSPGEYTTTGGAGGKDHNLNITLTLQGPQGQVPSVSVNQPPHVDYDTSFTPAPALPSSSHTDPPFEEPHRAFASPRPGLPNYTPIRHGNNPPPAPPGTAGYTPDPPAPLAHYEPVPLPVNTSMHQTPGYTAHKISGPPMHSPGQLMHPPTNHSPPHGVIGFPAPDASQLVSRNEIEGAFAALESKLTEAQRQDVAVLEVKLDQLLDQISGRVKMKDNDVQQQLRDMMTRIDALSQVQHAGPPMATTPAVSYKSQQTADLTAKVKMLEAQLAKAPMKQLEEDEPSNVPWRDAVTDYVDLLKQENSKKNAELGVMAHSTQSLQNQLGEQQQRYVRDVNEMQRKLSALEGHHSAVQETKDLAHKLHSAVGQAANAQQQAQVQHRQLLEATNNLKQQPSQIAVSMPLQQLPPQSQPVQQAVQPVYAQVQPQVQTLAPVAHQNEMKSLHDEIEELRRRDDLSRKLIHEKQMLLDTMFALSHQQQSNSPSRGLVMGYNGIPVPPAP